MNPIGKAVGWIVLVLGTAVAMNAQDFKIFGRDVQVHGFGSQGFAYSDQNNVFTMNTSHGSPALTEGAVNLSTQVTDKFRFGAQAYARKIGSLDDFRPQLDWAYGDYKFADWFGLRGGKVKTVMGLYNDTQDMTFLYPWALLPQGVYPVDLRSTYISHTGGDAYGTISLKKAGKLQYTVYGGARSYDDREGIPLFTRGICLDLLSISGTTVGADLKWLPIDGLTLGVSWANLWQHRHVGSLAGVPLENLNSSPNRPWVGYLDFARGKWDFAGEVRQIVDIEKFHYLNSTTVTPLDKSTDDWFVSASYRATTKLQLGFYHSSWKVLHPTVVTNSASNHIFDEVCAARYDVNRFFDVKAEGHFMDGYGDSRQAQGFYAAWNPQGLKPKTNMLVMRFSFKF